MYVDLHKCTLGVCNVLREFVLNYRHPGPRRVWKGGSESPLRDQINGITGIRCCVPKWGLAYTKHYFYKKIVFRGEETPTLW